MTARKMKQLTMTKIAPKWAWRIAHFDQLSPKLYEQCIEEMLRPMCCVVGEAHGYSPMYNFLYDGAYGKAKKNPQYCQGCQRLGNKFSAAIQKKDRQALLNLRAEFVAHWNKKHLKLSQSK